MLIKRITEYIIKLPILSNTFINIRKSNETAIVHFRKFMQAKKDS